VAAELLSAAHVCFTPRMRAEPRVDRVEAAIMVGAALLSFTIAGLILATGGR
jgi:hypothetical protein